MRNPSMSLSDKKRSKDAEMTSLCYFFPFNLKSQEGFTISDVAALALFLWYYTSRSGITVQCYCFDIC